MEITSILYKTACLSIIEDVVGFIRYHKYHSKNKPKLDNINLYLTQFILRPITTYKTQCLTKSRRPARHVVARATRSATTATGTVTILRRAVNAENARTARSLARHATVKRSGRLRAISSYPVPSVSLLDRQNGTSTAAGRQHQLRHLISHNFKVNNA